MSDVRNDSATMVASPSKTRSGSRRIMRDAIIAVSAAIIITVAALWWWDAPLRNAQRYLEQGDVEKALNWADYCLQWNANNHRAQSIKAQALVALERPEEAIQLFETPEVGVRTIHDTYLFARAYLMVQQWSRALPLLNRVLQINPEHPDALYEITTCRMRLGFLIDALESAKRYADLPGYEARGQIVIAVIQNDLGNYTGAVDAYALALDISPTGEDWQLPKEAFYSQYATALLKAGMAEEAVKLLEPRKRTPIICTALGDAYSEAGELEKAVGAWNEALAMEPNNIIAIEGLADAALQQNQPEEALKLLAPLEEHADSLKPSTAYLIQLAYARVDPAKSAKWQEITAQLRQRTQRQTQLDRVLLTAPYSNAALLIRAHQFAKAGNYVQAADLVEELLEIAPDNDLVQETAKALRTGGELPSLDRLPINVPQSTDDQPSS